MTHDAVVAAAVVALNLFAAGFAANAFAAADAAAAAAAAVLLLVLLLYLMLLLLLLLLRHLSGSVVNKFEDVCCAICFAVFHYFPVMFVLCLLALSTQHVLHTEPITTHHKMAPRLLIAEGFGFGADFVILFRVQCCCIIPKLSFDHLINFEVVRTGLRSHSPALRDFLPVESSPTLGISSSDLHNRHVEFRFTPCNSSSKEQ